MVDCYKLADYHKIINYCLPGKEKKLSIEMFTGYLSYQLIANTASLLCLYVLQAPLKMCWLWANLPESSPLTLKTQHQHLLKMANILWWLLELWKMLMELCIIKCNMKRQEAQEESSIQRQGCASCAMTMKMLKGSSDFTAPLVTFHCVIQLGLSLIEIVLNSMLKEFSMSLEQHHFILMEFFCCCWPQMCAPGSSNHFPH